jgi:hypothetical protein
VAVCSKVSRQSLCRSAVNATCGLFATASRSASVRVHGQLAHKPVGQWLDGIVVVLFRVCLAADRDDGALAGVRARSGGAVRGAGAALDGKEDSDTVMEGIPAAGWGGRMRKGS